MNSRWPLELDEAAVRALYPELTRKHELVVLAAEGRDDATYVRHCGVWVLLDAEHHGHPSRA